MRPIYFPSINAAAATCAEIATQHPERAYTIYLDPKKEAYCYAPDSTQSPGHWQALVRIAAVQS